MTWPRRSLHATLGGDDLLVGGAVVKQRLVRAAANDAAVVEHDDLVGIADRRDALAHDDHGRLLRVGCVPCSISTGITAWMITARRSSGGSAAARRVRSGAQSVVSVMPKRLAVACLFPCRGTTVSDPSPLHVRIHEAEAGGHVHVLTLDRPQLRNAMNTALLSQLVDALADADADPDLVGLLVTGASGHFSAGADLKEAGPDTGSGFARRQELFTVAYEQITSFRAPTVAAVQGYAVGGGVELAAGCDLLVLGHSAKLRFPGAIHGIPVGVARTVGRVGLSTAKDWVLSSRMVAADEAYASGFAQRLVEDDEVIATAMAWLEEVATRDTPTVELLKRMFTDMGGVRDRSARENDGLRAHAQTGRLPSFTEDLPRTVRPRR
jgi:enoyl-CoA hydratase/carnithine racemase